MRKLIATVALATLCSAAYPQEGAVHLSSGFFTGNAYRQFSMAEKQRYIAGMLDGFFYAPAIDNIETPRLNRLEHCIALLKPTDVQLVAVVDRFLDANPVRWGESMHGLVWGALTGACKQIGISLF